MFEGLKSFVRRLRSSTNYTDTLEVVLGHLDPGASLYNRLSGLVDLMHWVRYRARLLELTGIEDTNRPESRLIFLFSVLERNAGIRSRVAEVLVAAFAEVRYTELFASTGLPEEMSLWSELGRRIGAKFMPHRPLSEGGEQLLAALFPEPTDQEWVEQISPEILTKCLQLLQSGGISNFASLRRDAEEALVILASQVRSMGLSFPIRRRLSERRAWDLPFHDLTECVEQLIARAPEAEVRLRQSLSLCSEAFNEVHGHLDHHGVSLKVVYLLQSSSAKLKRMEDLLDLVTDKEPSPEKITRFLGSLIVGLHERASVGTLLTQNTQLIAQKIVDRSAEVGEDYIAQNKGEFRRIFQRALGGGVYMSLAVIGKIVLGFLHFPSFLQGVIYSLNYSAVFVGIQMKGHSLATKQPAMTGPTLASKVGRVNRGEPVQVVVDEIVKLVRTQWVGIFGNLISVIPVTIAIDQVIKLIADRHVARDAFVAEKLMNSSHLLGPTVLYAAFTGVLLWLSSIVAGYVDNWFYLNRMEETIRLNRRINYVLGNQATTWLSAFLERNISGLSGNVSLAFFLGLLPEVLHFFGVLLEARHVTLSAGNLALGACFYGLEVFKMGDFWFSAVGVLFIGLVNVSVSFYLAFLVALRSRGLKASRRSDIYKALWSRVRREPLSFLLPR